MEKLDRKIAVVTGGASGMGKGIAEKLLSVGVQVIIADVDPSAIEATSAELGIEGITTDVSRFDQVQALAEKVMERYGAVDILCNNAGVGPVGMIADLTLEDWRWMLDINLWGVIHGIHAFLPYLKRNADGGHIINTASQAGLISGPGFGPYCASKYGVVAVTEVLAQELELEGSLVRASVLLPGPTKTAIATSSRHRKDAVAAGLKDMDLNDIDLFDGPIPWKTPTEIGQIVLDGVASGELYLFTHPELSRPIFDRFERIRGASDRALNANPHHESPD
ncbi:SDR family NAD(P)-dependent oxidoreductase [Sphingobium cupriresistens]|uniref:SDR family NAD(P)-dependent oxidoreductase n=1 Tax=Sphingobium cupriresistens TaxID=1132417 RepID=UPI003BAE101B